MKRRTFLQLLGLAPLEAYSRPKLPVKAVQNRYRVYKNQSVYMNGVRMMELPDYSGPNGPAQITVTVFNPRANFKWAAVLEYEES